MKRMNDTQSICLEVKISCKKPRLSPWLCSYLGQRSLAVMFPDARSSGIRTDSPGFLRILTAFSRTCCSIESKSGLSGGSGFGQSSSSGPSDSLNSWSSSTVSSCNWPFFFFFLFFFLAICKQSHISVGITIFSYLHSQQGHADLFL